MIKMIVVLVNIICMVINDKDGCSSIECYSFMVKMIKILVVVVNI